MIVTQLIKRIFDKVLENPSEIEPYEDLYAACTQEGTDPKLAHETNRRMRELLIKNIRNMGEGAREGFELYRKSLLFDAPVDFDSYMLYLEIDRPPSQRFYQPRRKVLKPLVDAMQQLADDELDELFLSMPPRVGKTSVLMFYVTWIIGRNSEASNLYSAYSDTITKAFYNGVLEIINDPVTYKWKEIFPTATIATTNSQDETLNIDRKKRYPSLTCRSLYGTLNGACDCNGIEISDDLIGGIEEALNKDRLIAAWEKVDNNLIPRAKETAKILWCGTRWSVIDPAGKRMDLVLNDEKYKDRRLKIINVPALDENDESNFQYDYNVGFSTAYYHQRRASFERNNDIASWNAQYMGEPIEREGALFRPEDMRYYNGELPDGMPERIFMPVDPAFGGGDFVSSPIIFKYNEWDWYIHDVVFDDGDKKVTQKLLVDAVKRYNTQAMRIEANKSTESYKDEVERALLDAGIHINITTKAAPTNQSKEARIYDKAPDIRERMIFRESGKRSKAYELFMQNLFSFKLVGKNKHDDAPDSLAMGIDMGLYGGRRVEIFPRPF